MNTSAFFEIIIALAILIIVFEAVIDHNQNGSKNL